MTGRGLDLLYIYARLVALVLLAAGGIGAVQGDHKPSPASGQAAEIRDLSLAETIPFLSAPSPTVMTATKCDGKGNIYTIQSVVPPMLVNPAGLSGLPVTKFLPASKLFVPYPVPALDHYRGVIRVDFDVTADGTVYSLLEALDASSKGNSNSTQFSSFVGKYRDEGALDSYVKLGDAPKGRIQPSRLAVFRNGHVLVAGTIVNEGEPLQPFVAVFDAFGRFINYVQVSENRGTVPTALEAAKVPATRQVTTDSEVESNKSVGESAVGFLSTTFMVSGPDGNVYLLRGGDHPHLYAISPVGEVIKAFDVALPAPGLTATNMTLAGDSGIFISFGHVEGSSSLPANPDAPSRLVAVISTQTGEVSAAYRLPSEADGFSVPACATSSNSFLFLGPTDDQQHQQVVRYIAR
jgi:hypothetical protein